ncbi:MAG: TerB family tellurite resistance protein, partial [Cryomorphaceae bacterium]
MKKYAKWIGGGMGWVLGGPIGALLGFAIGSMIDTSSAVNPYTGGAQGRRTTTNDFVISMLVLSAAVMKADGTVKKSELDYVKAFFARQFGARKAQEQMLVLRELLKQPFDLVSVCNQIRDNMPHPMRLQMMHYLLGIAAADGSIAAG